MSTEVVRVGALEMRFLVEGDESDDAVSVFEVLIPAGARVLCVATPGMFDPALFRDMGATFAAAGSSPTPEQVAAAMGRHGLTPAP